MGATSAFLCILAVNSPTFLKGRDSAQWVVLAVGALATLYLLMRPRIKAKKDPLEHRPVLSVSQQRQVERDMSNLMVEMLETARQMTAQLDTRAARLEVLIGQADERLVALRAGMLPEGTGESSAKSESAPAPQEHAGDAAAPLSDETPPDPRHGEVWALADEGQSPNEIARRLNRPNGEIELILALRPH